MQVAMVGLGRMGGNMLRRLARSGVGAGAFDRSSQARAELASVPGVVVFDSLAALAAGLAAPRVAWLMLPAGAATEDTVDALAKIFSPGDVIVDGGNAWYHDSMSRAARLRERGIRFVDAGVSGGIWGLENGYGLMLGGEPAAVALLKPYLQALAPDPAKGWVHCGPSGAGHFAKMIHNGIEYGMMQAYAEGFALLRAKHELEIDVAAVAEAWRYGTVIRSWLLDLTAQALSEDSALNSIAPRVADSGEGRWTAAEAIELGVPAPVITAALIERFASQGGSDYGNRLLARMRQAFGGHAVTRVAPPDK